MGCGHDAHYEITGTMPAIPTHTSTAPQGITLGASIRTQFTSTRETTVHTKPNIWVSDGGGVSLPSPATGPPGPSIFFSHPAFRLPTLISLLLPRVLLTVAPPSRAEGAVRRSTRRLKRVELLLMSDSQSGYFYPGIWGAVLLAITVKVPAAFQVFSAVQSGNRV